MENPEEEPALIRQEELIGRFLQMWLTNVSGLTRIVGDQRAHHLGKCFHLFLTFGPLLIDRLALLILVFLLVLGRLRRRKGAPRGG